MANRVRDYDENIIGTVISSHRSRRFSVQWLVHEVLVGKTTVTLLEANGRHLYPKGTRVQAVAYESTRGHKVRAMRDLKDKS